MDHHYLTEDLVEGSISQFDKHPHHTWTLSKILICMTPK